MSIATRIQSMIGHIEDTYDVLETGGTDLTNVDKNIENIKDVSYDRLKYFMANGVQIIWDNWEKVTGSGESYKLTHTVKAPMRISLRGNTSQSGTPTPSSPIPVQVVSGDNSINVCGKNLFNLESTNRVYVTPNTISITGTGKDFTISSNVYYDAVAFYIGIIDYDTIYKYLSSNYVAGSIWLCATNSSSYSSWSAYSNDRTIISSDWAQSSHSLSNYQGKHLWLQLRGSTDASGYTSVNYKDFVLSKTQATTYEPYQGTSYPINLGVENLFDMSKVLTNGTYIINNGDGTLSVNAYGTAGGAPSYLKTYCPKLKVGDKVTFSFETTSTNKFIYLSGTNQIWYSGVERTLTQQDLDSSVLWYSNNASTINTISNIQIEYGSKVNSYTPYGTTPIELCRIDTYQDYIKKSSGRNIFDNTVETKSAYPSTTTGSTVIYNTSSASTSYVNSCYVEAGKTYTFSCKLNTPVSTTFRDSVIVDENNIVLENFYLWKNATNVEFTPQHSGYLILCVDNNSTNLMISKGSIVYSYEPYGTDWYLKKGIRHLSLAIADMNNSDNYPGWTNLTQFKEDFPNASGDLSQDTNYFTNVANQNTGVYRNTTSTLATLYLNKNYFNLTQTQWKSQYPNLVFDIYYGLPTPTYTKITNQELINQLEAIKSCTGETNISQTNNDLPFTIEATALKEV